MSPELKETIVQFREGLLGSRPPYNMCFIVCLSLQGYLQAIGFECELTEGKYGHFWITFPSGEICDPTASQFQSPSGARMPDVYFGHLPEWYDEKNGLQLAEVIT
jgi:hypothetical protein